MRIHGSTILLVGGTSGIGLAFARRFRDVGARVIIAGRSRERLTELAASDGFEGEVVDTADADSVIRLRSRVAEIAPDLDTLVTMAGIMELEPVLEPASLDVAERTVATNLLGPIRLVHAFAPMLARREHATILTVSSGLAYVPRAATPTYSATKAAIHSYTESLRYQLRETSIQVIELAPPLTRTRLMGDGTDNDRAMPLDEFVDESLQLLAADPDAPQILVGRVRPQRFAVAEGTYDELFLRQARV
jgi:uncharacterized oxidoreductase